MNPAILCHAVPCCDCQEVEATDESAIYERATWDRLPLDKWSAADGRVLLLGDAAHAMYSGEGGPCRAQSTDACRARGGCALQPEACLSVLSWLWLNALISQRNKLRATSGGLCANV